MVLVSSVDNVSVHVRATVFLHVPSEAAEVEDEESVKAIYVHSRIFFSYSTNCIFLQQHFMMNTLRSSLKSNHYLTTNTLLIIFHLLLSSSCSVGTFQHSKLLV